MPLPSLLKSLLSVKTLPTCLLQLPYSQLQHPFHTPQPVCNPNYMVIICLHILFLSLDSKLLQGVVLPHENVYTLPGIVMLNWQIQALKAL